MTSELIAGPKIIVQKILFLHQQLLEGSLVCQCLEKVLKPTLAQNSIMNMLQKSPVNQLHEEIHIKDEPLIENEFDPL